jgi:2-dehydro-3-deoxygalactonokinase
MKASEKMANDARMNRLTVALDGGTTNTRARLLAGDRVVATARRAVGVRNAVVGESAQPLAEAVRDCLVEILRFGNGTTPDRIVAAGMLSSEVGLAALPHIIAPAGCDELARAAELRDLPEVADQPILIIPGIRTSPSPGPDGWAEADVMRGEECETLGAWQALRLFDQPPPSPCPFHLFVWPGSHTKLVAVDTAGKIVRSHTTLAGEMLAALTRHTLLAASLPTEWPLNLDPEAADTGARLVARVGLGRAAFLVRIAALTEALSQTERAAFWIGALVADDADYLARHPLCAGPACLWVGGRQPQRDLYTSHLSKRVSGAVTALSDELCESASALGAIEIARRYDQRI